MPRPASPTPDAGVTFVPVDLTDERACADVFGELRDVTRVVFAALHEKPGLIAGWTEADQIETNRQMLRNLFEPLASAAVGLRHVTLLQGTKAYGAHFGAVRAPAREREARVEHENFYWLQKAMVLQSKIPAETEAEAAE